LCNFNGSVERVAAWSKGLDGRTPHAACRRSSEKLPGCI